jgi:hypothetical protein
MVLMPLSTIFQLYRAIRGGVILDEIQGMMLKGVLDYKKKQDPCVINNEIKRGGNKRSLMTKRIYINLLLKRDTVYKQP